MPSQNKSFWEELGYGSEDYATILLPVLIVKVEKADEENNFCYAPYSNDLLRSIALYVTEQIIKQV